jgi:hypothetical protein
MHCWSALHGRGVETSRRCILCHADSGSSTDAVSRERLDAFFQVLQILGMPPLRAKDRGCPAPASRAPVGMTRTMGWCFAVESFLIVTFRKSWDP